MTEAAAICAYLADVFPAAGLAPPTTDPRRGAYYRWLFFAAGPVEAAVTAKALNLLAPSDKKAMAGYGSFDDTMNALQSAVGAGAFLCGDQFTAADVYVASQIGWGMMFDMLPRRDAFVDYYGRCSVRPAAVRARELDDAAMRGNEDGPKK